MNFKLLLALALACVALDGATADRAYAAAPAYPHMRAARDKACVNSCMVTMDQCFRNRKNNANDCKKAAGPCMAKC